MPYIGAGIQRFNTADGLTVNGDAEVTGTVNPSGDTASGDAAAVGFTSTEGLILTGQGSTSDITVKNDADAVVFSVPTGTDDILFPDNAKAIFGAGSDLQIYHDGSDSYINDTGTGQLRLAGSTRVDIISSGGEFMGKFTADGAAELYHDNSKKLETTSTGIDITGGFTATDGCTITTADNDPQLILKSTDADASSGPVLQLFRDSASPADSDVLGQVKYIGRNDAAEEIVYGKIDVVLNDASDGTEDAEMRFLIATAGDNPNALKLGSTETVFNDSSKDVDFRVESDGNANMLVVDGGNNRVGIGTSPSYTLHVDGFIGGKAVEIGRTGGAGHTGGSHFYLGSDLEDPNGPTFTNANYRFFANRTGSVLAMNSSGSGYFYEGTNDDSSSATRQFAVETDGDVRNTNNSYGSLSDQSIKQDVADASSQWEDIKNLRVRKFRLIADVEADADAPYHLGLVAQEVETVSPGLVKVEIQRDALKDADGNPILDDDGELQMQETGELKAVKYSILYMKAVKALQEAMTRIETLETEMTALKARVTALEDA